MRPAKDPILHLPEASIFCDKSLRMFFATFFFLPFTINTEKGHMYKQILWRFFLFAKELFTSLHSLAVRRNTAPVDFRSRRRRSRWRRLTPGGASTRRAPSDRRRYSDFRRSSTGSERGRWPGIRSEIADTCSRTPARSTSSRRIRTPFSATIKKRTDSRYVAILQRFVIREVCGNAFLLRCLAAFEKGTKQCWSSSGFESKETFGLPSPLWMPPTLPAINEVKTSQPPWDTPPPWNVPPPLMCHPLLTCHPHDAQPPPQTYHPPHSPWCMAVVAAKYLGIWGKISSFHVPQRLSRVYWLALWCELTQKPESQKRKGMKRRKPRFQTGSLAIWFPALQGTMVDPGLSP